MKIENYITNKLNYPTDFLPSFVRYACETDDGRGEAIAFGLSSTDRGTRMNRYFSRGQNGKVIRALIEHGLEDSMFSAFRSFEANFLFLVPLFYMREEAVSSWLSQLSSGSGLIPGILIPSETNIRDVARATWRKEIDFLGLLQRVIYCLPRKERRGRLRIHWDGHLFEAVVNLRPESWTTDRAEHPFLVVPGLSVVLLRDSTPIGAVPLPHGLSLYGQFGSVFLNSPISAIFEMKRCFEWVCDRNLSKVDVILPPAEVPEYRSGPSSRRDILWSIDENGEPGSKSMTRSKVEPKPGARRRPIRAVLV